MENLIDITTDFGKLYIPQKALVFYATGQICNKEFYIEAFDIGNDGTPINAKPLSVRESCRLAMLLNSSNKLRHAFLKPKGLLPESVLYINPEEEGFVIWQTRQRNNRLFFKESLGIRSGKANIPALIWKANRNELFLYALNENVKATENTALFHAPFFNIYESGSVCMGNVGIDITPDIGLEDFIAGWEQYFFNSYFSHSIYGYAAKTNIVQLWQGLIDKGNKFPNTTLKPNGLIIKDIL